MVLDEENKQLITKNKKIKLTDREFLLINFLILHKYEVCSYKDICEVIYHVDEKTAIYYDSALKTMLKRIRKKIENEDFIISTVHGFGLFTYYNIDETVKKRFRNFAKEQKIIQLKEEIFQKKQEIHKIEESFE